SFAAILILEIGERELVVNANLSGCKFENIFVLVDGFAYVGLIEIKISERHVAINGSRAVFEFGRQEILRRALFGVAQIFAIARAVVEPNIAGELLIAIELFSNPVADCFIAKRRKESCIDLWLIFREVQ